MRKLVVFAAALATCATGCVGYTPAWTGAPRLPKQDETVSDHDAAARGWARLARLESRYRDAAINFESHTRGLDAVRYPTTSQLRVAWEYVFAGRDFERQHDDGAAARAYWAALALAPHVFASRPDRERMRGEAYEGLASVAAHRGQPTYASLLRLCAQLATAYVKSAQADEDASAFRRELRKLQKAEDEAKEAEAEATRAMVFGSIHAGLTEANGVVSKDAAMQARGQEEMHTTQNSYNAATSAIAKARADIGEGAASFRAVAADDVAEVQAGKSFVAYDADFDLTAASSFDAYLPYLRSFAKSHPEVAAALDGLDDSLENGARAAKIKAVAKALLAVEVEVAKCERRGVPCAPPPAPAPAPDASAPSPPSTEPPPAATPAPEDAK